MPAFWSRHAGAAAGCRCRCCCQSPVLSQWLAAACCLRALLSEWCVCVCALERACSCRCSALLEGAVTVVCVLGAGVLVPLRGAAAGQGAAARCCLKVLLSELCSGHAGAAAGCWLLVPLQGAAAGRCFVKVACALWSWHVGAAAWCCCCQSAVCALELVSVGCRCKVLRQVLLLERRVRCGAGLPVPLHGAVAAC